MKDGERKEQEKHLVASKKKKKEKSLHKQNEKRSECKVPRDKRIILKLLLIISNSFGFFNGILTPYGLLSAKI